MAALPARSMAEDLSDPTPFEIAYGMSFFEFDACGDAEAGRIFRRALMEKFARCPFTPDARVKFDKWRLEALEDLLSKSWEGYAQGETLKGPSELYGDDGKPNGMTCADYRATPRYRERHVALLQYDRGEIDAEAIIPGCPAGPASL